MFPFVLPSGAFELWLFEKSHQRLCVWALYHNFPRLNNTRLPGILFPQSPSTWGASVSKEVPLSGKRGIATKRVDERLSLLSLRFLSLSPLPPKKAFFFFRVSPFYLFNFYIFHVVSVCALYSFLCRAQETLNKRLRDCGGSWQDAP